MAGLADVMLVVVVVKIDFWLVAMADKGVKIRDKGCDEPEITVVGGDENIKGGDFDEFEITELYNFGFWICWEFFTTTTLSFFLVLNSFYIIVQRGQNSSLIKLKLPWLFSPGSLSFSLWIPLFFFGGAIVCWEEINNY